MAKQQIQKKALSQSSHVPNSASYLQTRPFSDEDAIDTRQTAPVTQVQSKQVNNITHSFGNLQIQPKLTIGEVGDKYEQEADRVAAQVAQRLNAPTSHKSVQRQEMPDEDELQMKPIIQRQADCVDASTQLESSINQARGGGQALAPSIRQPMEQAFGADFSGVRVHTDAKSDQLNHSIQAKAFTTGKDIFFRQGEYNPQSSKGQELLAHELTHTIQQGHADTVSAQLKIQPQFNHPIIQRDILSDWKTESNIKYSLRRSKELKKIDDFVELLNNDIKRNKHSKVAKAFEQFEQLYLDWENSKGGKAKAMKTERYPKLQQLSLLIKNKANEAKLVQILAANQASKDIKQLFNTFEQNVANNNDSEIVEATAKFDNLFSTWESALGGSDSASQAPEYSQFKKLGALISSKASDSKATLAAQSRQEYSTALNALKQQIDKTIFISSFGMSLVSYASQDIADTVKNVLDTFAVYQKRQNQSVTAIEKTELSKLNEFVRQGDNNQTCIIGKKIIDKINQWQKMNHRYENAIKMDADMSKYAKFNIVDIGLSRFSDEQIQKDQVKKGLGMERNGNGGLTNEAMQEIAKADIEYKEEQHSTALQGGVNHNTLNGKEIEALMAEKNTYTGQTVYPELKNLIQNNGEAIGERTETKNVSGVAINVTYDKSDVNFVGRWSLIESAVQQVQAAGFTLPSFNVYLPKWGRKVTISVDKELRHEIKASSGIAVAVMIPPNTVQISSEVYQNPKVATGLSIRIDPTGVATIVHELGHFMHCQNAPAKFAGLNFTTFKGLAPDGVPWSQYVSENISQYGGGNPREFVAEMFVGLVYRKIDISQLNKKETQANNQKTTEHIQKFTKDQALLEMYKALGGALPLGM